MKFETSPSQEPNERHILHGLFREYLAKVKEEPVLNYIEQGGLTPEQWKEFAIQRYQAAELFDNLLEAAIQTARDLGNEQLVAILHENLCDELGINPDGSEKYPETAEDSWKNGSHAEWRKDFYTALGVSEEELHTTPPLTGTEEYSQRIQALIEGENGMAKIGAIYFLEILIPAEFNKIKSGRNKDFPERFVVEPNDTSETILHKRRAALYIDDHIIHDGEHHFHDLDEALTLYAHDTEALNQLREGIEAVWQGKQSFYQSLEETFKIG